MTLALLYGMHFVTKRFEERDPTQYFPITEFIPASERRMPPRPPTPQAPPERPRIDPLIDPIAPEAVPAPSVGQDRLATPPLLPEPSADPRGDNP